MFQAFNLSEKSWGNLANMCPEKLREEMSSLGTLSRISKKNSGRMKKFTARQIRTVTFEEVSHPISVLASSQTAAFDEVRGLQFSFPENPVIDQARAMGGRVSTSVRMQSA